MLVYRTNNIDVAEAGKKAWRLIFAKGLLGNYLDGSEQWSFRKYSPGSHEFTKFQIIEGHFLDGVMLLLEVMEDTKIKPFREITVEEIVAWGGRNQRDMMRIMRVHYPLLTLDHTAAMIKTRLVRGVAREDGRPFVGPLPEGLL